MSVRRLVVAVVVAAFLVIDAGPAAFAVDPSFPTGSFSLVATTSYIFDNPLSDDPPYAQVGVERLALHDDLTAPENIVVSLFNGRDVEPQIWPHGAGYNPDVYRFRYEAWSGLAGTYSPYLTLDDGDGHVTTIDLPQVTLVADRTAPVTTLTLPRRSKRHTIAAWRIIRGTILDHGISAPRGDGHNWADIRLKVLQRRHGWYYFYEDRTWHRGFRSLTRTNKKFLGHLSEAHTVGDRGAWRTRWIRGLTRGALVVYYAGADDNANFSTERVVQYTLTRRR